MCTKRQSDCRKMQKVRRLQNTRFGKRKVIILLVDLSILHGGDIIKTWENVEIKSTDSRNVQFIFEGVNIISSQNNTIILEEVTSEILCLDSVLNKK